MNQEDFITYEYSIQGKVITVTPSEAVLDHKLNGDFI